MDRDVVSGLELVMKRVRRGGVCFMQISRKLRFWLGEYRLTESADVSAEDGVSV
jgi:hypothetical protein